MKLALSLLLVLGLNVGATNQSHANSSVNQSHHLNKSQKVTVTMEELSDNQGLVYIGGVVEPEQLDVFLKQLKSLLNEDFELYRNAQSLRDHGKFHITLINPFEYKELTAKTVKQNVVGKSFEFDLLGLGQAIGQVNNKKSVAYFVVANGQLAQEVRTSFNLKAKDFHVTLGFLPSDVYGVSKGQDSLIP